MQPGLVEGVGDDYLTLSWYDRGSIAELCHRFSVRPDGVCKVSVNFVRAPLDNENLHAKIQIPRDDSLDLFNCEDPDHCGR